MSYAYSSRIRLGFEPDSFCLISFTALILFALILGFPQIAHPVQPAQVTLAWDANNEPQLAGYKVYHGFVSKSYQLGTNVGNLTSFTFTGVEPGRTYYFAATAYDNYGNESDFSNEVVCQTITSSADPNGVIIPYGTVPLAQGKSQTYTITPAPNCVIADVQVDGISIGPVSSYTFTNVTANHTISATFAASTHAITASAGANGSMTPSGTVNVNAGASQSFAITPASGYRVADVKVDGTSVGAVTSYTFTNVTASHTISATFADLNQAPVADAGPDQKVNEGTVVKLNGTNSSDPDDGIASYLWAQTGGPPVTLSDATAANPTFIAPSVGSGGESLGFTLMVADGTGLQSHDSCIINVCNINQPPTANAGADLNVAEWAPVTLDGSLSNDSDDGIVSYLWEQIAGPTVKVDDTTKPQLHFTAPDVGVEGSSLTFRLTVADSCGLKASDTCVVNITWVNMAPTAVTGGNQSVIEKTTVTLCGASSCDIDDGIASYRWTQTSGPPVTLSDPTAIEPTFTAPDVGSTGASLGFLMTVTDHGGLQATGTCTVDVCEKFGPDLAGNWAGFAYANNTVTGDLAVKNIGTEKATNFGVSIHLSDDGTRLLKRVKYAYVAELAAGQSVIIPLNYRSSESLSGQSILAVLDKGKTVAETNETNNRVRAAIGAATQPPTPPEVNPEPPPITAIGIDLTGQWMSFAYVNGVMTGELCIRNVGSQGAGYFAVPVYLSDNGKTFGLRLKYYSISELAAGQSVVIPFSYASTDPLGGKYLIVSVDRGKAVAEANEDNNVFVISIP
jgi:hypothetical protein